MAKNMDFVHFKNLSSASRSIQIYRNIIFALSLALDGNLSKIGASTNKTPF